MDFRELQKMLRPQVEAPKEKARAVARPQTFTLDAPPPGWTFSSGFIDEAMVRAHLPAPSSSTYIFCCGPPPMIEYACKPNLVKVGHEAEMIHCF